MNKDLNNLIFWDFRVQIFFVCAGEWKMKTAFDVKIDLWSDFNLASSWILIARLYVRSSVKTAQPPSGRVIFYRASVSLKRSYFVSFNDIIFASFPFLFSRKFLSLIILPFIFAAPVCSRWQEEDINCHTTSHRDSSAHEKKRKAISSFIYF